MSKKLQVWGHLVLENSSVLGSKEINLAISYTLTEKGVNIIDVSVAGVTRPLMESLQKLIEERESGQK